MHNGTFFSLEIFCTNYSPNGCIFVDWGSSYFYSENRRFHYITVINDSVDLKSD
jgi:hypothetical protein